jgi:alpha-ketoglutarate-dependent taurine dioxygenase
MIELNKQETTLAKIGELVLLLRDEESPLILRNACDEDFSENEWFDFLEDQCKLLPDLRHISFEGEVTQRRWWEISNQVDKSTSYAHSTTAQPFHTDNAWFSKGPEVNFFIMKRQASNGGENLFYPISRIINDLEKQNPSLLNDLTETEVAISKGNHDVVHKTPIIINEGSGEIFWNFYRTDKSDPFIDEMCQRFFAYLSSQEEKSSVIEVKCETKDAFLFNDQKLLHARRGFKASKNRERVLLQSMWYLP